MLLGCLPGDHSAMYLLIMLACSVRSVGGVCVWVGLVVVLVVVIPRVTILLFLYFCIWSFKKKVYSKYHPLNIYLVFSQSGFYDPAFRIALLN